MLKKNNQEIINDLNQIIKLVFENNVEWQKDILLFAFKTTINQNNELVENNLGEKGNYSILKENEFFASGTTHFNTYPYLLNLNGIIETYIKLISFHGLSNGNKRTATNYLIITLYWIIDMFLINNNMHKNSFGLRNVKKEYKEYENKYIKIKKEITNLTQKFSDKKINKDNVKKEIYKIINTLIDDIRKIYAWHK